MAGVQIGALHVSLSADSAAFDQNMQQAQEIAEESMDSISETATKMAGALAAAWAAIASVDAIITATKEQIDYADSLGDVAARSNQAAEALSAYEYALAFSDASLQDYTAGLQKLEQNMAAASEGSKEQALVFETLGIQLREQDGMLRNSGDVMLDFADVLAGMANGATKTQLAMDVLGESAGPALLPFLNQGKEGIEEFTAEAERMGLVVSTEFSDAAGQLNDNLDKLGSVTTGLWRSFADGLTPALVDVSNAMIQAAQDADYFKKVAKDFGEAAGVVVKSGYTIWEAAGVIETAITETLGHNLAKAHTFIKAAFESPIDDTAWKDFQAVMADTSAMEKVGAQIEKTKKLWHEMTEEEKKWAEWKKQEDALFADLAENTQKYAALAYEESKKRMAEEQAAREKAAKAREDAAKKAQAELEKQQAAVDKLAESFMTESQKEQAYYEKQKTFLTDAKDKAFKDEEQRKYLLEQLETQHLQKIQAINDKAAADAAAKAIADSNSRVAELEQDPVFIDIAYESQRTFNDNKENEDFLAVIDQELLAMDAANVYKLNAQKEFNMSWLLLDQDRINAVITNGDAELEAKKAQMQATVGFFNQGLSQMAQGQGKAAKAAQAIQKAQALYEIGVNTYRAAVGAYAALSPIPFVGPALGVAAAAAAIAFGGSMAQGVLSGGGSPSVTGGAPPALPASSSPTSQAEQRSEQPTLTTYVRIPEDAILTGRKMLDFIDEAMGDGKQLNNLRFIPA